LSSNTNIGNTPVNQGYVQLIHTGETGGIDGTLRTLYDGDGTASDLQIASNKVKVSTELYIGSKTATEFIQDIVGDMFTTGSYTNITTTYDDTNGNIDLSASGEVTLTGSQTLTNKTLASPTFTGTANGANLTLTGDLTVSGDTIFTNSNNVLIGDAILTLNADETGSPTANAGFEVERGTSTNKSFVWNETDDKWTIGSETFVAGTVEANLTGNVTGNADTSTKIASITNSDIVQLTSTQTLTNKTLASPTFTGDIDFSDANTPKFTVTDTTNTVKTEIRSQDTSGTIGTTTDHNFNIVRNGVGKITFLDAYTMHNNGGNDLDFRAKDSSGNVVFKVDAGTSKTEISTLLLDSVSVSAIQSSGESFANNDTSLMTSAAVEDKILSYGYITEVGIDEILAADIIDSTEAFSDSDDLLMTAAAIDDLIVSKGYGTGNGDITAVTAGVGIGGGGLSGDVDLTFEGSELPDMTDLMVSTDEFVVLDGTTSKRKAISEIRLTSFDDTGFSSGISFNGSTANGLLTYGNSTTADVESNLTFDGATGNFSSGDGSESVTHEPSSNYLTVHETGATKGSHLRLATDNSDFILTAGGSANQLSLYDVNGTANRLVVNSSGLFQFLNGISVSGDATFDTDTLKVDSTNNRVGIGTTSPQSKLHIDDSTNYNMEIRRTSLNGIKLEAGSGSPLTSKIKVAYNDFSYIDAITIVNQTAGAYTQGNVGIGTTSPLEKLHIYETGNSAYKTYTSAGAGVLITSYQSQGSPYTKTTDIVANSDGTVPSEMRLFTKASGASSASERLRIDSSGNVGIGVTSPSAKLHISESGGSTDDAFIVNPTNGGNRTMTIDGEKINVTYTNTGGSTNLVLQDGGGNVGIGTSSPQSILHVGTGNTARHIKVSDNRAMFGYDGANAVVQGGNTKGIKFNTGSDTFTSNTRMTINSSGNVGIGTTSPSGKLHVSGDAYFTGGDVGVNTTNPRLPLHVASTDGDDDPASGSATGAFFVTNSAGSYGIEMGVSSSGDAWIQSHSVTSSNEYNLNLNPIGGNVGIGTSSPADKLHVSDTTAGNPLVSIRVQNSNGYSEFGTQSTYARILSQGTLLYAGSSTPQIWYINGSTAMTLNTDGLKVEDALGVGVSASTTDGRGDFSNDVVAFSTSDERLKENIKPLDSALDKVLKISGVEFDWKELTKEEKKTIHGNEGHDVGVIAQEIEQVLPEVVTTRDSGYKAVKYEKIVPLLIQAIKEQQQQIEELKNG